MIKLNNKNITYVALADSNNSLKAPKEIWYADSNNSVKLVYRRKDALIEGEDYEKYHWLVSNSEDSKTPYIDTLIIPNLNQNIAFSFRVINSNHNGSEPGVYGAVIPTSWSNCVIRCYKNTSYNYIILEYNNNNADFPQRENMIIKTEFSDEKEYDCSLSINSSTTALGVINGESKELVANSNVNFILNPQPTHKFFMQNGVNWSFNSVGFKKFSITNIISLVPCKLLKPVPKWLDANGIRRQVGECGMIDLVSGKFYGNVNSVGTFTVENYYERKEWLLGTNNAYISGVKYNVWQNKIQIKVGEVIPMPSATYYGYFVLKDGTYMPNLSIYKNANLLQVIFRQREGHIADIVPYQGFGESTMTFYVDNGVATVEQDGFVYSGETLTESTWNTDIELSDINNGMAKVSYIREVLPDGSYRSNLIPCTLTMDLPASMDANNIARTKGTSGMWDLVSDRFYGNVANSGTFKAVNLAEGVDYEVHQWLKLEETTIRTGRYYYISIPLSSLNFSFRKIFLNDFHNTHYFYSDNYSYYTDNYRNNVWNRSAGNQLYGGTHSFYINTPIEISSSANKQVILGEEIIEIPDYTNPVFVIDGQNYNGGFNPLQSLTSAVTVDGIEHYIPVKLLKSIPSKYDANGIARQAGECGMYDTVNDVFYGNVASSGTFSVSDDS